MEGPKLSTNEAVRTEIPAQRTSCFCVYRPHPRGLRGAGQAQIGLLGPNDTILPSNPLRVEFKTCL